MERGGKQKMRKALYGENYMGKRRFTVDIIKPLARQAGFNDCDYIFDGNEEYLHVTCENNSFKICVTADSCVAMVKDFLQGIQGK